MTVISKNPLKNHNNWKSGKSSSYLRHLDEIATFLGVTPNYLISGSVRFDGKDPIEDEVVKIFRSLSEHNQRLVLNIIKAIAIEP